MLENRTDTTWLLISESALDAAAAVSFLHTPHAGGIDIFIGTTRQWTEGRETAELAYECYAEMAIREMERLVTVASSRWPILKACVLHRVGLVPVAHASVIIGVATPHRSDAFDGCRFLIDTLKEDVPIWKKEVFTNGSREWVSPMGA